MNHIARAARALVLGAGVTTVAAVAVVVYPNPDAPAYPLLSDVSSANVVTPSPHASTHTTRDGKRETLAPSALPSATHN